MTTEIMIAVRDVAASSAWYQHLLGCTSNHGGPEFDRLIHGGNVVLLLHHWGAPEHPTMLSPASGAIGHGVVLYFRVPDVDAIYQRAVEMKATALSAPAYNEQAFQREFSLRDPDGYLLTVCQ